MSQLSLAHYIRRAKFWSFSFSISPSSEYSRLISFMIDRLDPLAVQRILNSLLQSHNPKASVLWHSAFFIVQLSYLYMNRVCLQCRRPEFDPWVGKIPWRKTRQPTPVFLLGESPRTEETGGLQSVGSERVGHNWETKYPSTGESVALTIWNFVGKVMSLTKCNHLCAQSLSLTLCDPRDCNLPWNFPG